MKNSFHEIMCIIIPLSLFLWTIDFLSDSQINKNETKLGILQYLHFLVSVISFSAPIFNIFTNNLVIQFLSIMITIISQAGHLVNNDYCWLTIFVNKCIDPTKPNRKWRANIDSFIKHYIRGDSWAYSDMYTLPGSENGSLIVNLISIAGLIKFMYSKNH